MSRELWSLRVELLNGEWEVQRRPTVVLVGQERGGHLIISNAVPLVSSLVQQCQDQQDNHWKAVQTGIREAKSNIATVSSKVQSGNDKLKTVLAGILLFGWICVGAWNTGGAVKVTQPVRYNMRT